VVVASVAAGVQDRNGHLPGKEIPMNTTETAAAVQAQAEGNRPLTNSEWADRAQYVIDVYMQRPVPSRDAVLAALLADGVNFGFEGKDQETQIMDIVVNCRHLADREKIAWDDVLAGNSGHPISAFLKALHDLSVSERLNWEWIMSQSAYNHACEVIEEADTSVEMIRGWNLKVVCDAVNQAQWRRDGAGMYADQRVSPSKFPQLKQRLLKRAKKNIAAMAKLAQINPEKIRAIREAVAAANGISANQVIDPNSVKIPDSAIWALVAHSGLSYTECDVLCEEDDGYGAAIQQQLCRESLRSSAIEQ
jgi:hypothetical protein